MIGDGGGSLTFDATHSRGPGLAVKHEVGYHGNAYYGWGSEFAWAPTWFGRVYVWFDSLPDGSARLVRSRGDGRLRFAIDLLPSGRLSLRDSENESIVTTSSSILTGGWVRIEWMVNHAVGSVQILMFNSPNITTPTETLLSPDGVAIGPNTDQVHIGRSGSQLSSTEFWTDDPAISTGGFVGPAVP
jgi:hypothetical protein